LMISPIDAENLLVLFEYLFVFLLCSALLVKSEGFSLEHQK